jgi:peptidoglycan/LPS O-acetylase OafA/YrhL
MSMNLRRFNWPIWAGFLLSLVAFISYFLVFVWFPVTRDFPWANLLLFVLATGLLIVGLRRAFSSERSHPRRSKIGASILATLGIAIFAFFVLAAFILARRLPASTDAPQVGRNAPDFTLADTSNKPVSLSELLASPINGKAPKGVLLIFYRGYW